MHGFTMIELLVTISIAAIMLAIAVPAMSGFLMNNRLAAEASSLQADIAYARSEAVRQNTPVSLCPAAASTACSGGIDWSVGWITFVDTAGSGVFVPTAAAPVPLRVHNGGLLTSAKGTGGLTAASSIVIRPTGETKVSGGVGFCMKNYAINSLNLMGSGGTSLAVASTISTTCP